MTSMTRRGGLVLVLLTCFSTTSVIAQPPGGFGGQPGGFGGRMRGGGGFDPSRLFDMMAQGKDVITRDQLAPQFQGMFDRFAQRMNITDGKMTRQQFTTYYMQQRQAQRGQGRGGPPSGAGTTVQTFPAAPPPMASGPGTPSGGMDAFIEARFRRYDRRGNGQLTLDEVPDEMKVEYKRWDTNGDGFIDLAEFKAYAQARIQQLRTERGGSMFGGAPGGGLFGQPPATPPAAGSAPAQEELPSNFYRRGKLPKEVPAWFTQLDTDGDGQIGVYEWRKSGRPFSEFQAMDRNGDGFITIEEVVRYVRANTPRSSDSPGTTAVAMNTGSSGPTGMAGPSGMARPGFGAMGGQFGAGGFRSRGSMGQFGPGGMGSFGGRGRFGPSSGGQGTDGSSGRRKRGGMGQYGGSGGDSGRSGKGSRRQSGFGSRPETPSQPPASGSTPPPQK